MNFSPLSFNQEVKEPNSLMSAHCDLLANIKQPATPHSLDWTLSNAPLMRLQEQVWFSNIPTYTESLSVIGGGD